ncbi:MAG: metallophosphatase family protein [bacterium]|nr:metallophosphatase family protein [bacterium]
MKLAIFSDIHGNLEALTAMIKYLEDAEITNYLCGGDIVGYGANPNECVDIIAALDCPVVLGNHDHAALGLTEITYFNHTARAALLWTRETLTPERKKFLTALEFTYQANNIFLVHASPRHPEQWEYILSLDSAEKNFEFFREQICFIGHSHQPFFVALREDGQVELITENPLPLKEEERYIINVGSVGQPRDGNPKSSVAILDTETQTVTLHRVSYDIKRAQQKIIDAGLPHSLAQRLENGW